MQITKRIIATILFSGGMFMLLLAMTGPRHLPTLGYIALWVGAVTAIGLAAFLNRPIRTNQT